jgi:hypothetical protein
MKRATVSEIVLALVAMLVIALLFTPTLAKAVTTDPPVAPTSSATANPTARVDLSVVSSPTGGAGGLGGSSAGGNVSQGHTYVAPPPAAAAPLPAGLCPKGDSQAMSLLWGLVSWASSTTRSEMECLDKVLGMLRDTAPKPPQVISYLADLPVPPKATAEAASVPQSAPIACPKAEAPPKPAKPTSAAAKKPTAKVCG